MKPNRFSICEVKMKYTKFFPFVLAVLAILLNACGATAKPASSEGAGGSKVLASEVAFTGVVESINGDQWMINGQLVQVDTSVIRDGAFVPGDTVKVEARVEADGSVTALRIENPSVADLVEMSTATPDPSSDPSSNETGVPGSVEPPQGLVFDDSGNEAYGTVDEITDTSITVGGQTFSFTDGVEIASDVAAGAFVELHFVSNPDGTLSVTEVELSDPSQTGNDNGMEDNSNDANSNDDDSDDDNSNGDNSNDDDSDDDDSDDDDSDDDNSNNGGDDDNEDNSNGGNDNDD
jgi:hypothetical protein